MKLKSKSRHCNHSVVAKKLLKSWHSDWQSESIIKSEKKKLREQKTVKQTYDATMTKYFDDNLTENTVLTKNLGLYSLFPYFTIRRICK